MDDHSANLHRPLKSFSPVEVATLLRSKRLGAFAERFLQNEYDGEVLQEICEEADLQGFEDVARPIRKKFLRLLVEWRRDGVAGIALAATLPSPPGGHGAPPAQHATATVPSSGAAFASPLDVDRCLAQLSRSFRGRGAAAERQTLMPLRAVLDRIVRSPGKSKYRRVKVGAAWDSPICALLGTDEAVALLRAVGFADEDAGHAGLLLALGEGDDAIAPLATAIAALDRRVSELSAYVADISSPFSITVGDVVRPREEEEGAAAAAREQQAEAAARASAVRSEEERGPPVIPARFASIVDRSSAAAQPLAGGMDEAEGAAVQQHPRVAAACARIGGSGGAEARQQFAFRIEEKERRVRAQQLRRRTALESSFRLHIEFSHDEIVLAAQFNPAETVGAVRAYIRDLLLGNGEKRDGSIRPFDLRPALSMTQPEESATLVDCGVAPSGRLILRWTAAAAAIPSEGGESGAQLGLGERLRASIARAQRGEGGGGRNEGRERG